MLVLPQLTLLDAAPLLKQLGEHLFDQRVGSRVVDQDKVAFNKIVTELNLLRRIAESTDEALDVYFDPLIGKLGDV